MRWTRCGCPPRARSQRFAHWLPAAADARRSSTDLLKGAVDQPRKLGLKEALDLEEYFLDSTCLKANIHFPDRLGVVAGRGAHADESDAG